MDSHFPQAPLISGDRDNLPTHTPAAWYEPFTPAEARRILQKLDFREIPPSMAAGSRGRRLSLPRGPRRAWTVGYRTKQRGVVVSGPGRRTGTPLKRRSTGDSPPRRRDANASASTSHSQCGRPLGYNAPRLRQCFQVERLWQVARMQRSVIG